MFDEIFRLHNSRCLGMDVQTAALRVDVWKETHTKKNNYELNAVESQH